MAWKEPTNRNNEYRDIVKIIGMWYMLIINSIATFLLSSGRFETVSVRTD